MYNKHKMYTGGANYTPKAAKIIRYAGLFLPILLVLYGIGIQFGYIDSPQFFSWISFLAISFWWLLLSILQFLTPSKTRRDSAMRLICYHLLAAAYLLFVSGVSTPFVAFWIVLLLASNTYFSKNGLNYSVLWFVAVVGIDIAFWLNKDITIVAFDAITLVAIVLSGLVIMSISRSQEVDKLQLSKSKQQENLQRDRILTIVNNLANAVLSTTPDGTVEMFNAATLNLLDTNTSVNGKNIDDILQLTDKSDAKISMTEALHATAKTAITRDDLFFTYENGEKIRLEVTYSPIRSSYSSTKKGETHDGYIVIMRDITKAKSLEEERDEFISVVSHELRTPITIAEGTISNVQVMMKHPDSTKQMLSDAIDMAHDQTIYLAKMVNDLSTLSRAERGVADKPETIDVREMMHKLHDEYAKDATAKGLHLNLDLGATLGKVSTSRLYLEEMLQNFITNAIKYTKTGTITMSAKQKVGIIKFTVKDTGIGISKSDQTKIYQKFYRSEDYRTRETSGTGLGLYVAAKLAHKVGTKIMLISRLNHGSAFSFTLPVKK